MIVTGVARRLTSVKGLLTSSTSSAWVRCQSTKAELQEGLDVKIEGGIRTLTLNRPSKRNAITRDGYLVIRDQFYEANADINTRVVVVTGAGNFFCAGNDLSNFDPPPGVPWAQCKKEFKINFQSFVGSLIDLEKPLILLINGPAVGIGVTMLGHSDAAFATASATFSTPFSSLGQSPEGCSSYTLPRVMGYAKALQLVTFSETINAEAALESGLLTAVFPDNEFQEKAWKEVKKYAKLPPQSMRYSKLLTRDTETKIIHDVNRRECDRLAEMLDSENCKAALEKFKSKNN